MKKVLLVLVMLGFTCSSVFAWPGGYGRGYAYHPGSYHRSDGWFALGAAALVVGTIIATLPRERETVIVDNRPYYMANGVYYSRVPNGYIVVEQPVTQVIVREATPFIVNIPNNHGSYTSVSITSKNGGYIGPQGEFYQEFPSIKQLQAMYGK